MGGLRCCSLPSPGLLSFFLFLFLLSPAQSGCRDAGLCCPGRDSSCVGRGWRSDRSYGSCYCDQACSSTGDCCHDYDTACPAVSCVVSEWTAWSGCAEPCKATIRRRSRTILKEPKNAGQPCPSLEEHAGCAEYWSQQGHCHNSLVPALITSGGYGNARKKRDVPDSSHIIGYCVQFKLTSLTKGCQQSEQTHTQWMQNLREGHRVCVECQPPALAAGQTHCSGDGEEEEEEEEEVEEKKEEEKDEKDEKDEDRRRSLQWQAVGNPQCRGAWRRVGRLEACTCPTAHSFLFI